MEILVFRHLKCAQNRKNKNKKPTKLKNVEKKNSWKRNSFFYLFNSTDANDIDYDHYKHSNINTYINSFFYIYLDMAEHPNNS